MEKMKLTSLRELSEKTGLPKSKLNYYVFMGLLDPIQKIGNMFVFNEKDAVEQIKLVSKMQKKGLSLEEMVELSKK